MTDPISKKTRATTMHIINMAVNNLEKTRAFYLENLGFEPLGQRQIGVSDSHKLFLHERSEVVDPIEDPLTWFEIATYDIEGFYQTLKNEGCRVSERYDNPGCGKYFDVYDPDGRRIIVCQDWHNDIPDRSTL